MRRGIRGVIVTLACASAIGAAVAATLSGARNPSLLFATSLTDGALVHSAIDSRGFIYLAGNVARSPGLLLSPTAAFVTKLTPSGTPLYTTYFQGARFGGEYDDCGIEIHAIAVDPAGAAYVAGCTSAVDFPVVRPLVATLPDSRGSAFVAKLDPSGAFVYSTYFGAANATAISADDNGNAYIAGLVGSSRLPLVNPTLTDGSGFAAKLDPSGARILYSTYVDASLKALAVDRTGAAFLAGGADTFVSATARPPRCRDESGDAVVIKLAPSGSRYDYAVCLGGSGSDDATGIAVDSSGAAYVVGVTGSVDFPTAHPLDLPLHTGALWKTDDGGDSWTNLPLADFVNQLVATAAQPPTWFANGSFRSLDQGRTWQRIGQRFFGVTPDPRSPRTLYGTTFEGAVFKSLDGGEQWTAIGAVPRGNRAVWPLVVDPRDSRVLYAVNGRVWRSVDAGTTWTARDHGLGTRPIVDGLAVDPAAGVLFADNFNNENPLAFFNRLFTSMDGGATWTPAPLSLEKRFFTSLLLVPGRRSPPAQSRPRDRVALPDQPSTSTSTIYVAARQFFSGGPFGVLARSDDNGATWTAIGAGLPAPGVDAIAAAPHDPALIYAASDEGLFISRDHGDTFARVATPWTGLISAIAIDPRDSRIVFVGSSARTEGFVAKIAPGGGALEYATYLGGAGSDTPLGVAVDELGRAIVFGTTDSDDFPSVLPLQQRGGGVDGFVSVVDGGGSLLLTSTWIGGRGDDRIASLALRGGQMIIGGGSTDVASLFPGAGTRAGGFVGVLDLSYGALGRSRAIGFGQR